MSTKQRGQNFEAWNNLAKAYVKLGQKPRAWRALQEAVKCNFENWRVWDNILAVGMDCGEFSEVIEAYHHLLDLKEKHVDTEVLQILVQAVTKDILDSQGIPAGRLRAKLLTLFGRLTSQVTNNSKVWWLYSQLTASQDEKTHSILQLTVQFLQKAHRSAVQDGHWIQDTAKCKNVMDISISLVDACLELCKNCSSSNEALQVLSSAKLSLKGVISRLKQEQTDPSSGRVDEDLSPNLTLLEGKLEQVLLEINLLQNLRCTLPPDEYRYNKTWVEDWAATSIFLQEAAITSLSIGHIGWKGGRFTLVGGFRRSFLKHDDEHVVLDQARIDGLSTTHAVLVLEICLTGVGDVQTSRDVLVVGFVLHTGPQDSFSQWLFLASSERIDLTSPLGTSAVDARRLDLPAH
uniref:Tetratricopeptide repeat protein 27 n=1 Tax=Timema bartmani TaxID=61472 RepID=A0A7R9F4R8_9NEOP|nr:unnamed protein product [Timema bartmani]